jgi:hypothetical protein
MRAKFEDKADKLIFVISELYEEISVFKRTTEHRSKFGFLENFEWMLRWFLERWKSSGEKIIRPCAFCEKILDEEDIKADNKDANRKPICVKCEEETSRIDWDEMYGDR